MSERRLLQLAHHVMRTVDRGGHFWALAVFAVDGAGEFGVICSQLSLERALFDREAGLQGFEPGALTSIEIEIIMQKVMQLGRRRRWRR